ncbi:hypothetical protein [Rhizobium tubonense]|uniref:hypothetical protein n=1 Tax=Rhizobium tubonense TaxID=484088 RepID=UPI0018A7F84A|nr:hypothetical protein [Rhizobium tubonense]
MMRDALSFASDHLMNLAKRVAISFHIQAAFIALPLRSPEIKQLQQQAATLLNGREWNSCGRGLYAR